MGMKTTAVPKPTLIHKICGMHQGEGYGDGRTRMEEHWEEWYDNGNSTYTKKTVVKIITTKTGEEDTHIHKIIDEPISKQEYFKQKLAGTL